MKKFKDIKAIKTNPEPAKGKNVDPGQLGQYSAKHQVSESASLNQYLSSRGINPKFVSTATKIAHSKSALFIKWKQDHMQRREDVQPTELTPEETVNEVKMDNISPAAQNHVTKGRVVKINVGYGKPETDRPKPKVKPKKTGFFKKLFAGEEVQLEASKLSALDRFRTASAAREIKHNDIEKERQERLHKEPSASNLPHRDVKKDGMSDAIRRLEKHMNKEEVELAEEQLLDEMINEVLPTSEDMWQDTQAATQTPADGANGGNELAERKRQMSKSARMIKALYKKHRVVKEDMYDHEKEDKSVATYGKKPKMSQTDKKDSLGGNKPQAAATLTGGTTLTGVKRDSIEIDPIMRNRPGQPDISKKSDKKENNKNDK